MIKTNKALQLKTLAIAICLAAAGTAYADNDNDRNHTENHSSNHTENHSSTHTETHSNSGSHSGSSSSNGKVKLNSYLTSVSEATVVSKIKLEQTTKKAEFEAEISRVPVPSIALDLTTLADATGATMTLVLSDSAGTAYASCDFDVSKTKKIKRSGVTTYTVDYKIKLSSRNGYVQEKAGVCDTDLNTDGVQSGVPAIIAGDTAEITVDTNSAIVADGQF